LVKITELIDERALLPLTRVFLQFQPDPRALGEAPGRLHEGDVLVILDEPEDIPALVTSEAVIRLPARTDMKAGGLLLVERTERHKAGARAPQRDVPTNDLDDVARPADLLPDMRWDQRHQSPSPASVNVVDSTPSLSRRAAPEETMAPRCGRSRGA